MTRYIKALGLAMVAALAMSAVAASSASAEFSFGAEEGVQTLTGDQATPHVFTAGGSEVRCNNAVFDGTSEVTEAEEQTIEPTYSSCTAFGLPTHVNMNGCDYLFTTPDTTHPNNKFTSPAPHVVCPEGEEIELTPTFFGSVCTVKIPPQTPDGSIDYTNQGSGDTRDILVVATVENITYSSNSNNCGEAGHHEDGTYTGTSTLRGFNDTAHTDHGGIFINH